MQYINMDETVYLWFGANDTSGSGGDGATPLCDIRLAGAAASAAPVYSPTPALLTEASYPDGCHEVAISATSGNGFAAGNVYAVFCALTVDSQNPTGFVGEFKIAPVLADTIEIMGTVLTEGGAGRLSAAFIKLFDVATPTLVASDVMRGTDGANTVVPDAAGVAPTAVEIQTEMEEDSASLLDTIRDELANGTDGLSALKTILDAIKVVTDNQANLKDSGTASGTPTATTMISDITISIDDQFNGRSIVFKKDTTSVNLRGQATEITDCTASSDTLIFTQLTNAPVSGDTFDIV